MKIKELMSLELFKTCKLLTNEIGLENEVDSAMVLEALDIENWSRKNQLILTSFYAFKDLPATELAAFFKKMKKMGVSGLVVKMDRLITMIPDWLIDLCFKYQIPLIKVEQDISYEKIILTIYEPLLNYQGHLLRTYYDVRQRFTKVERNLHSFEQIMATFYQLIKLPCSLTIASSDTAIYYGERFDHYTISQREHVEATEFTKNRYERLLLHAPDTSQQIVALRSEITNHFANNCVLMVYQDTKNFAESQMMILENVIDIIHERLQMEYLIKKDRYTRMNNLADAILQNTPTSLDELNSLLDKANMNQYKYYQGIAVATKNAQPLDRKILQKLCAFRTQEIFFEHYNYTVILYNLESREQAIQKAEIKKTFLHHLDAQPELTFAASLVKEKSGLKEILLECLDAIRFNHTFQIDPIVSINDLGVFRYFMRENQLEQLEQLVPIELRQLWQTNYELFNTLYTFFRCGRNYKKTAETLFLHSKTIRYRLNKIEQSLMIDLTNPIQLVNYEIGTYLLKTKQRSNEHE